MKKSEAVAETIRKWISSGKYSPGERLPSILNLSRTLKVSDKSVQKAVAQLAGEGLLRRENGVGVFVRSETEPVKKIMLVISNPSFLERVAYFDYLKSEVYSGIKKELEKSGAGFDLYPLYELIDVNDFVRQYENGNYMGVIALGELQDTMPGMIAAKVGGDRIVSANFSSPVSGRNEVLVKATNGVDEALEKAYELGHRNFAMIYADNMTKQRTHIERFTTFTEFCNRKNISVPSSRLIAAGKTEMDGYRAANSILDKSPETSLIFAANDCRAEGVLQALKDRNLTPGKEVSVIGYDNMPRSEDLDLTTVNVPRYEAGRQAVLLLEKCMKERVEAQCIWLETKAVFRGSLGPAPN
jgi:DNA-binding LacI/PurR family transcriptional regulator